MTEYQRLTAISVVAFQIQRESA